MAEIMGEIGGIYRVTSGAATPIVATKLASTTGWTVTSTRNFGEIRRHGDNWVTREGGIRDWTASGDLLSNTASNQTQVLERLIGTGNETLVFAFYETAATLPRWQGQAVLSEFGETNVVDDLVARTFTALGDGTLSYKE